MRRDERDTDPLLIKDIANCKNASVVGFSRKRSHFLRLLLDIANNNNVEKTKAYDNHEVFECKVKRKFFPKQPRPNERDILDEAIGRSVGRSVGRSAGRRTSVDRGAARVVTMATAAAPRVLTAGDGGPPFYFPAAAAAAPTSSGTRARTRSPRRSFVAR